MSTRGGLLRAVVALGAVLFALQALAVVYPTTANVFFQTSGRDRAATVGDWYTTSSSSSTDRVHRILVEITAAQLAGCGGSCSITVQDAESTVGAGPLDEVFDAGDPTRFELRDRTGTTTLAGQTFPSGSPNGSSVTFFANAVGVYQVVAMTGAFPISGNATVALNNDDNAWRLDVQGAGGATGGYVGFLRTSFEHNAAAGITYSLSFLLGPTAADLTLALRNFDLDSGATSVTYTRPDASTVAGTVSGNGVWNNGGSLNVGQDNVAADSAFPGGTAIGAWGYRINGWSTANQAILEAQAGGLNLALSDSTPQRAGNFAMSAASAACGNNTQPVFQTFSITNHYFTNDIINLTVSAPPAGWTAGQLQTSAGVPLTDTDGNGQVDTGIMTPGQTLTFRVQTTPSGTGVAPYVAVVSGVSLMDARVVPAVNTTVTLTKEFYICPEIAKAFSPTSIGTNGISTITFTLTNRNSLLLAGLNFTDTYPVNLVNATPLVTGGTCAGVTTTAVAGGNTFNVTGGSVPPGLAIGPAGTCTITVQVTSNTIGTYNNTSSGASGLISGDAFGPGPPSNTATLTVNPSVSGFVYLDGNANGSRDAGEAGSGQALFVKLVLRSGVTCSGPATAAATVDPGTGAYSIANVAAGNHCLIVDNNATLADITPSMPAGYIFTLPSTGIAHISVAATHLPGQNFGVFNGSRITGRVFNDNGIGGGTANDGLQNGGEAGLANTNVRLTNNSGATLYSTATTSGAGDYTLFIPGSLATGTVLRVVEVNSGGFVSTGGSAGTTGGSYARPTDTTTFTLTAGTTYSGVNFADVPDNSFTTDGQQTALPGTTVYYTHTYLADTGGSVTFSSAATATPPVQGWSEQLFRDTNCNGQFDSGEPPLSGATVMIAGQQLCILLRQFVPANAPVDGQNKVIVTATFAYTGAIPALTLQQSHTDLTIVGDASEAGLRLVKAVNQSIAVPGATLIYTITYTNLSSEPLANITVRDAVPTYTQAPVACCVNPGGACLGTPATPFPNAITACGANVGGGTPGSSITWPLTGTLRSGQSGQVKFSVQVQP